MPLGDGAPRSVGAALRARLETKHLSVRSVVCIDSGIDFRGEASFRCKVDFGDPHIVPFCAVLVAGRLMTDREQRQLRCYRARDAERYRRAALLEPGR